MNQNAEGLYIFLPNTIKFDESGFLTGISKYSKNSETYYVTTDKVVKFYSEKCVCLISSEKNKLNINSREALLKITCKNGKILVEAEKYISKEITLIIYDYHKFKNVEDTLECDNYGIHFMTLIMELNKFHNSQTKTKNTIFKYSILYLLYFINIFTKLPKTIKNILACSATYLHLEESLCNTKLILNATLENKNSLKLWNIITAKLIDIFLGLVLINLFLNNENYVPTALKDTTEDIIFNLKKLLLYLMGSPIGLKLNHAFNNSLGQFFFYHISLWKMFLRVILPIFHDYFKYFVLLGMLGCSFQMAMLSDIISVATFHVYCIYVYAARLFNLQLKGIISLWRLFIGRKYNPLRERVDTCQYSSNQLFIGTLGFTVLLFLLPTTVMYYAVFSMFRVIILLADYLVKKVRFALTAVPLYILILWMAKFSCVAGTINIEVLKSDDEITRILVKLERLPLWHCIKKCLPEKLDETESSVNRFFHSIITGNLI